MLSSTARRLLYPLLGVVILTLACGGDDSTSPAPAGTTATLTLTNGSDVTAMFARIRPCGTTDWGADLLDGVLGHDESVAAEVEAGCYDIRVTPAQDGWDYLYLNGIQVEAGVDRAVTIDAFPVES